MNASRSTAERFEMVNVMKTTTIAAFWLLVLGFASTAAAQTGLTLWGCDAYPLYYQSDVLCMGVDDSSSDAGASSDSAGYCSDNTIPSTTSEGSAEAYAGGGAEGYADSIVVFYPYPGGAKGIQSNSYGWAWDAEFNSQSSSATAEVDCGGTAYSFEENIGTQTYAQAYGDITEA
jgi:hypothetical protein